METAIAAVVAIIGGCGASTPPATPAVASHRPTPTSPLETAAPTTTQPYPIVHLPASVIHEMSLPAGSPQVHRLSGDGPNVVFDEEGYGGDQKQGQTIWLAELDSNKLVRLATTTGDAAWMPVIRGHRVAWVEWHYSNAASFTGDLTWRVRLTDIAGGHAYTVTKGMSRAIRGPGAIPLIALTDASIVVAFPAATAADDARWQVDITDPSTGHVKRTLTTEQWVYSLAASDQLIAVSAGKVDAAADFVYGTSLLVADGGDTSFRTIAPDSFEVSVDRDRVVWVDDRAASQAPSPTAVAPRIYSASAPSLTPVPISPIPNRSPVVGSAWPSAGDGDVTWSDNHDAPPKYPDPTGNHLILWRPNGQVVQVEPTGGTLLSTVGDGWVAWYNDWTPTLYLIAVRLADIP